jgi:hypothetical protein
MLRLPEPEASISTIAFLQLGKALSSSNIMLGYDKAILRRVDHRHFSAPLLKISFQNRQSLKVGKCVSGWSMWLELTL